MKKKAVLVLNCLIVLFTLIGVTIMLRNNGDDGGLLSSGGWENLKYFTVLSNIFCGFVAAGFLINAVLKKEVAISKRTMIWKLMAVTVVTVTFLVVMLFFGPLYGWLVLLRGSNLEFHLIIPVLAMIEFCFLEGELSLGTTLWAGLPALVYGVVYLGNIMINGKGEWPDSNDWYGFLNWGLGVGMIIFGAIVAVSCGAACLLRWINRKINKKQNK